jgi:D-glycero-D-manno-heptose 1,7-bisphosphate phosphatase
LKKAVFLDRDGTINVEKDYLYRAEDFQFIDGVPQAIRRLKDAGYLVVVVTNQSGVARGYFSREDVDVLHCHLQSELSRVGTSIDAFYFCPHHPQKGVGELRVDCDCRKGRPGLLLQAAADLSIDLKRSFMVGDKVADIEAGCAAGCLSILVRTGYGDGEVDKALLVGAGAVVDDLPKAVDFILSSEAN